LYDQCGQNIQKYISNSYQNKMLNTERAFLGNIKGVSNTF